MRSDSMTSVASVCSVAQKAVMKKERDELLRRDESNLHHKIHKEKWNEGFHTIKRTNADLYALKASGINSKQSLVPLAERMNRYGGFSASLND